VQSGALPAADDEAAVSASTAESLGVAVGDTVTLTVPSVGGEDVEVSVTVTGVTADLPDVYGWGRSSVTLTEDAYFAFGPTATSDGGMSDLSSGAGSGWYGGPGSILVRLADGADAESVIDELAANAAPTAAYLTSEEYVAEKLTDFTGNEDALTIFAVAFGVVAVVVAGLVIGNTFQVLIAQRTRHLALLRCVGATTGQIRRSVLLEAVVLGLVASAAGVLLGYGILAATLGLWTDAATSIGVELPTRISPSPLAIAVPIVVGTAVCTVAALAPAHLASRVPPLAAMRPVTPPSGRTTSRGRKAWAIALMVVGLALVGGGVLAATALGSRGDASGDLMVGILVAQIVGSAVLAGSLMLGLVLVVPRFARWIGEAVRLALPGRFRATVRLGTANSVRNPHRTSATAMALVIGITLVTVVTTAVSTVRASLDTFLGTTYGADVQVESAGTGEDGQATALDPAVADAVRSVDGVLAVGAVVQVFVDIDDLDGIVHGTSVVAPSPEALATLGDRDLPQLHDGEILLSPSFARNSPGWDSGGTAVVSPADPFEEPGEPDRADGRELSVTLAPVTAPMITTGTARALLPGAGENSLWVDIADTADPLEVTEAIEDAIAAVVDGDQPYVIGNAVERAGVDEAIDTVMYVVLGLITISVVIALVGVTNTLSLSVIERRREIAMLRAVGMTRAGIRGSLLLEGVLITVVGALIGAVVGVGLGWAASYTLLAVGDAATLAVPWAGLGITLAVAVVAGALAAVIPTRAALRVPPVAALGSE
jgi:putative ABC transport system permease protein